MKSGFNFSNLGEDLSKFMGLESIAICLFKVVLTYPNARIARSKCPCQGHAPKRFSDASN